MNEKKDNKETKKEWSCPNLIILDIKATQGGKNPTTYEDSANHPESQ
jgi:hypothetical protein